MGATNGRRHGILSAKKNDLYDKKSERPMVAPTVIFVKKPAYRSIIGTFISFLSTGCVDKKTLSPSGKVVFTSEANKIRKGTMTYCKSNPLQSTIVDSFPEGDAFCLK